MLQTENFRFTETMMTSELKFIKTPSGQVHTHDNIRAKRSNDVLWMLLLSKRR